MKYIVVGFIIGALCFLWGRHSVDISESRITVIDTQTYWKVEPIRIEPITTPKIPTFAVARLPLIIRDTVTNTILRVDSVEVEVPRYKYVFEQDSVYRAEVSGFAVSMDKMQVFSPITYQTRVITQYKRNRWGLGVSAGYGITGANGLKFEPYLGVSINYNFITW